MTIYYSNYLHRFGPETVGRLINGDLPADDEERWNMVDAPRYRIQRLLDEHLRTQAALRDCRDSGRPFVLFLRSFFSEHKRTEEGASYADFILAESASFQQRLELDLENGCVPITE